jgi:hypothetical protein
MVHCPYEKNVVCSYLENDEENIVYCCEKCPYYKPRKQLIPPDPPEGGLCCVIVAMFLVWCIVILFLGIFHHYKSHEASSHIKARQEIVK